jgi:glycosyltransferase involved in cell wall biosynthesis
MKQFPITLIVEGSYPYVSGGVASWVHQLITELSNHEFELVVLLASSKGAHSFRYEIPSNVKSIEKIYLQDTAEKPVFLPNNFCLMKPLLKWIDSGFEPQNFIPVVKEAWKCNSDSLRKQAIYSEQSLELVEHIYSRYSEADTSFLSFFWNVRAILMGALNCLCFRQNERRVYHCVSTGYAGFLGACLKAMNPENGLILTEHGIYTRERTLEITIARWPDMNPSVIFPGKGTGLLKEMWNQSFRFYSRFCYENADHIISLFEKNNQIQIKEGADPQKVRVVRNGINPEQYTFKDRGQKPSLNVIGFLGRIVKIKDVKTFIRAAAIALQAQPDLQFIIAGPCDEDPQYFEECKKLVELLGIEKSVVFPGPVNAREFYDKIDILVLTSVSEGQPLVILEAFCCGVPVIAPDVGGCAEMILGGDGDHYGRAGILTRQAMPDDTASAMLTLSQQRDFHVRAANAGRDRAVDFYHENILIQTYAHLYDELLNDYS